MSSIKQDLSSGRVLFFFNFPSWEPHAAPTASSANLAQGDSISESGSSHFWCNNNSMEDGATPRKVNILMEHWLIYCMSNNNIFLSHGSFKRGNQYFLPMDESPGLLKTFY